MKFLSYLRVLSGLLFSVGTVHAFDLQTQTDLYRTRYGLTDVYTKLINNSGNGFEELYGARNVRVVLHGVLYRGGANNVENKYLRRSNTNPVQDHGLKNLCQEGFSTGIYLYATNYSSAQKNTNCRSTVGSNSSFEYKQISALEQKNHQELLNLVYKRIKGEMPGPIYSHCWNGWHASGLVAAISLIQFCNYTNEEALNYWIKNTDGHSDGYTSVKNMIRQFRKLPQFFITKAESDLICVR